MTGELHDRIAPLWDAELDGLPGTFSVALHSRRANLAGRDEHTPHYAASTIKAAVLAALLDVRNAGGRSGQGSALVHARFPSRLDGRFELCQAADQDDDTWARLGEQVELSQLAEQMITVSSNIATNLIVERIGLAAVDAFLVRAGLDSELVVQRMIGDQAAQEAGFTNTVTASGLASLLAGLAEGSWLPGAACAEALDILARQTHLDGIAAGLPSGVWSASKGGWVPGVRHDVALVRPASAPPYVLAVCTTSELTDASAVQLIAELSRITYQEWIAWHA